MRPFRGGNDVPLADVRARSFAGVPPYRDYDGGNRPLS